MCRDKLIYAGDFMDHLLDEYEMGVSDPMEAADNAMTKAKGIEAVPVVHGHWIPDPVGSCPFSCDDDIINHYKCSKCGRRVAHRADQNLSERFPYCNCGAKMDEEE